MWLRLVDYLLFNRAYAWALLLLGVALEAVALSYQYLLDYGPCPLCIHVRVGVLCFMLVSLLGLLASGRVIWRVVYLLNVSIFAGLSERAYWLLGTEQGFAISECGMDANFPAWLPLDRWLPAVFEPWESCGYTPELFLGISMAEASMLLFPVLLILSLMMLIGAFMRPADARD